VAMMENLHVHVSQHFWTVNQCGRHG